MRSLAYLLDSFRVPQREQIWVGTDGVRMLVHEVRYKPFSMTPDTSLEVTMCALDSQGMPRELGWIRTDWHTYRRRKSLVLEKGE